ncbi:low affinity iron permease family protein [Dyella sp. BiH032]|uniref:low affinity iron permease family protein n=1 Tax=Dyella sp. BiH032 TaxID=3075430 RepID=UPI0028931164|nr:low affinity iron permease family protein [Dyella sp. BiH032]WNL47099.1 low affinity iron permease family protein [Dyella sp. BiH032]
MTWQSAFRRFAEGTARYAGKPAAFLGAVLLIVVWAATGPLFHFGDTWQLVINTSTTIITFLMVFLIQSTQNRDTAALHLKLDELICSSKAHNALLGLEELDDQAIERIRQHYASLAEDARGDLERLQEGGKKKGRE